MSSFLALLGAGGPAGGGAAFSPSDLAGLVLWLDANSEGYADGASVTNWNDRSASNWDLVPGTAPTFETNEQNGKPTVRFNGTTHYLVNASVSTLNGAADATIFLVVRRGAVSGFVFAPAGRNLAFFPSVSGSNVYCDTSGNSINGNVLSDAVHSIYAIVYDGSQGTNATRLKEWLNGVSQSLGFSGTIPATLSANTGLTIGKENGGAFPGGCDLAEIIMYDNPLSDSNRILVQGYLGTKYNIVV